MADRHPSDFRPIERTPLYHVQLASDAVSALADQLTDGAQLDDPADLTAVVHQLGELAGRLPQVLGQIQGRVSTLAKNPHLTHDEAGMHGPQGIAFTANLLLEHATEYARWLATELRSAAARLSHLVVRTDG